MRRVKDRTQLLGLLPKRSIGVELGVLDGEFSAQIRKVVEPERLYLVDLFTGSTQLKRRSASGNWEVYAPTGAQAWEAVRQRFALQLANGQVQLVCAEACAWLASLSPRTIDWVYLDDDHTYGHVAQELILAAECVKPGGWIMGHDYCDVLPGVPQAVNEFCQKLGLEIDVLTDEEPQPVYPRLAGMPEECSYNSFAIQMLTVRLN
jgi:hypothetical protein